MSVLILGSLLLFALAVTLMALYGRHRNEEMLHQERMAGLEKGVLVPAPLSPAPWSPRVYLLRGLIWSMAGAALLVSLYGVASVAHRSTAESIARDARELAQGSGLTFDQARALAEKDAEQRGSGTAIAVSSFGLIPLGVGLAYLVFYYTDPSRKAGAGPS